MIRTPHHTEDESFGKVGILLQMASNSLQHRPGRRWKIQPTGRTKSWGWAPGTRVLDTSVFLVFFRCWDLALRGEEVTVREKIHETNTLSVG